MKPLLAILFIFIFSCNGEEESDAISNEYPGNLDIILTLDIGQKGIVHFAPIDDVDDDGTTDFLCAFPDALQTFMVSGLTGTIIWEGSFVVNSSSNYTTVTRIGDLDSDGLLDFSLSNGYDSAGFEDGGTMSVHSSANGDLIFQIYGQANEEYLGWWVADMGDINGDGTPDIAYSVDGATVDGIEDAGKVLLISGADRSTLLQIDEPSAGSYFSYYGMANIGDYDSDGLADILVGYKDGIYGWINFSVYSSVSGNSLRTWVGVTPLESTAWHSLAVDDMDQDGFGDIVLGAPYDALYIGRVTTITKEKGLLWSALGTNQGDYFGFRVGIASDLNGDNISEVLIRSGVLLEWAGEETRHTAIQILDGGTGRPLKSWRSSDLRSTTKWGTSFFITDDIDDDGDKELVVSEGGKVHFVSF